MAIDGKRRPSTAIEMLGVTLPAQIPLPRHPSPPGVGLHGTLKTAMENNRKTPVFP
jgi:hypothetical protein